MKISVNLKLSDDFLLTCEHLHVSVTEALMCYARNVKLYEASSEKNKTKEFKATQLFVSFYVYWCFSQEPNPSRKNQMLVTKEIDKIKILRNRGMLLESVTYENLINQLTSKLSLSYVRKNN